jgi:hypothetical protein
MECFRSVQLEDTDFAPNVYHQLESLKMLYYEIILSQKSQQYQFFHKKANLFIFEGQMMDFAWTTVPFRKTRRF